MKKIKAFAYIRVSSKGQAKDTKDGYPRQKREIERYAKENNITIEQIYSDDVSGTKDKDERPQFNEMVSELLTNSVNIIIVEDLSRLARKYILSEHLAVYLISKGINLISARNNENISESFNGDPIKKLLIQMQGIINEYEKSNLVLRLRKARERMGKLGGRKNYLEVIPETIILMKKLRRKPRIGKRKTYKEIAEILNSRGIKTISGKKFNGNLVGVLFHNIIK